MPVNRSQLRRRPKPSSDPAASSMAPRPPAALMDELVEEILLRIPPDDLARLVRAALVCKRWGRIVSDAGFRRRFREFHRTPPMLGFFRVRIQSYSFVSTSSFRRPPAVLLDSHRPIDARHGRVLLWNLFREYDGDGVPLGSDLMVWDPITDGSTELPLPPSVKAKGLLTWNAAVLCASAGAGGYCDHLDCARGHFLVVVVSVCNSKTGMFAHVYSSEAAVWSEEIYANSNMLTLPPSALGRNALYTLPTALVGNALYFLCTTTVLKYDLASQEISLIPLPMECMYGGTILRTTEEGQLGLANRSLDRMHLYLWSREVGPDEDVGWIQNKAIKLRKLLPDVNLSTVGLAGFAHGLDVIFVGSSEGTFTIDLKSFQATKVHGEYCCDICFPYMSFYTPALGAASAEGSRTGTSNV